MEVSTDLDRVERLNGCKLPDLRKEKESKAVGLIILSTGKQRKNLTHLADTGGRMQNRQGERRR